MTDHAEFIDEKLEAQPDDVEIADDHVPEDKADSRRVLVRAIAGEFVATFIFLFGIEGVALNTSRAAATSTVQGCIVTAFVSTAVIYSFADISGAHFNPAVTFATVVTGKTSWAKGGLYVAAQILGSIAASIALILVYTYKEFCDTVPLRPPTDLNEFRALLAEFFLTFFLIYVIFAVAFDTVDTKAVKVVTDKHSRGVTARNLTIFTTTGSNKAGFAPLAIGFTLGYLGLLAGAVSGGAYNPARAFGPALLSNVWSGQWIYWLGDLTGAAAGGFLQLTFFAHKVEQKKA
eukprot:GILK01000243.1.p1 GENE.GILK01000243.1~~GILK01000243.1.p1  ORF type:complete len:307 (+),score=55.41 GILK01000243.1:52-921(+)